MASLRAVEGPGDDDRLYDQIRRALVEGRYPPGQRLVEERLATEHGVSRTPVREVLRRLEAEGLVVVERNRGAMVPRLSRQELVDVYDVRARLEGYTAGLAAVRRQPDDIVALEAAAGAFDDAVRGVTEVLAAGEEPDLEARRALDRANAAFHDVLLEASRHTRIRQLVARATDLPMVFQALRHFGADDLSRSALFHHLIADAVAAGEEDRAARLMAEHVLQGRDVLLAHWPAGEAAGPGSADVGVR